MITEDDIAIEVYRSLKGKTKAIDMIKKKGLHPREIKSDMILFKEVNNTRIKNTYYEVSINGNVGSTLSIYFLSGHTKDREK